LGVGSRIRSDTSSQKARRDVLDDGRADAFRGRDWSGSFEEFEVRKLPRLVEVLLERRVLAGPKERSIEPSSLAVNCW
jgi:hypothetical protein